MTILYHDVYYFLIHDYNYSFELTVLKNRGKDIVICKDILCNGDCDLLQSFANDLINKITKEFCLDHKKLVWLITSLSCIKKVCNFEYDEKKKLYNYLNSENINYEKLSGLLKEEED